MDITVSIIPAVQIQVTEQAPTEVQIYDLQRFQDWQTEMYLTGEKLTGRDAGLLWQQSRTATHIYLCTKTGDAGVAEWYFSQLLPTGGAGEFRRTFIQTEEPENPADGDIWISPL